MKNLFTQKNAKPFLVPAQPKADQRAGLIKVRIDELELVPQGGMEVLLRYFILQAVRYVKPTNQENPQSIHLRRARYDNQHCLILHVFLIAG